VENVLVKLEVEREHLLVERCQRVRIPLRVKVRLPR